MIQFFARREFLARKGRSQPFTLAIRASQTLVHRKLTEAKEEAVIVASCPSKLHHVVSYFCKKRGFQKAFGPLGGMVGSLSGSAWVAKWEAKVAMATVTKAETLGTSRAKIICISGGHYCDLELARQPQLVKAIKQGMQNDAFRVRVESMEFEEFMESYGDGFNEQKQQLLTNASGQDTGNNNVDQNQNLAGTGKKKKGKGKGRCFNGKDTTQKVAVCCCCCRCQGCPRGGS